MEFVPSCKIVERIEATNVPSRKLVCSFGNIGPINKDMLIEVLYCLPIKIMMRCCCVCKAWYVLIHRYCVPRIIPSLPFLGCELRISPTSKNPVIGRAVIPEAGADVDVWPPVFNIHYPTVGDGGSGFHGNFSPGVEHLLDSQYGLMLFRHPFDNKYVLWNPNTKQFLLVPCPGNPGAFVALAVEIWNWKPDIEMSLFKIVSFPQVIGGNILRTLDVFHSRNSTWFEHKVKYINNSNSGLVDCKTYHEVHRKLINCVYILDQRSVYLRGKIFILSYPHNLSWFSIGDSNADADVDFDFIDLPDIIDTKTKRKGCIGSSRGNLQYAQIDEDFYLVQIWVVNADTREWTEMYCLSVDELFPPMKSVIKLLALHPVSDDGLIIWSPNLMFCYYLKSRNLVPLQCSDVFNKELKESPADAFVFTQCLLSLAFAA